MAIYDYRIGATLAGMTNLENLTPPLPAPKSYFRPFYESITLADGSIRGMGSPVASWRWGVLSRAQRDALRVFCTSKSATVYIRTRKTDSADAYTDYRAIMIWPDDEERDAGRRLDFLIEFRQLVVAT